MGAQEAGADSFQAPAHKGEHHFILKVTVIVRYALPEGTCGSTRKRCPDIHLLHRLLFKPWGVPPTQARDPLFYGQHSQVPEQFKMLNNAEHFAKKKHDIPPKMMAFFTLISAAPELSFQNSLK